MHSTIKKTVKPGHDIDEVKAERSISILEPVDAPGKLLKKMQINLIGQGQKDLYIYEGVSAEVITKMFCEEN